MVTLESGCGGPRLLGSEQDLAPEAFYGALFSVSELPLFVVRARGDGNFVCENVSESMAAIVNRSVGEMLGKMPHEGLPDDIAENLERKLRQCADGGVAVTYNMSHDWPTGRASWTTTLIPVRGASGAVGHVIGLTRDITFEARRQIVAERNEALLEQIRTELPQIVYLFNLRTRSVQYVAGQKSMPHGYRSNEFVQWGDQVVPRLVHPDDIARTEAHLAGLADLGDSESISIEYRVLHNDGTYRHIIDVQTVFSRSADGEAELIFGIADDITAQDRMQDEMRGLSDRLQTMRTDERRRIAQELHDSTGQHLVAAELALARIHAARAENRARIIPEAIEDARESIGEAKKEIRILSYLLQPPHINGAAMSDAIRSFAIGFAARAGLGVETRIPPQGRLVSDEVALACFRVCQEAMVNVHRHAVATQAVVALDVGEYDVTLEVRDDGIGFDEARLKSGANFGVGIPAMRERMERLGGSLRVESGAQGTSLIATVPADA